MRSAASGIRGARRHEPLRVDDETPAEKADGPDVVGGHACVGRRVPRQPFGGGDLHVVDIAHLGGEDGLDIVRRTLAGAGEHLNDGGGLICEVGTGRELIEAEFDLPFTWLDTELSEGEVFWLSAADLD